MYAPAIFGLGVSTKVLEVRTGNESIRQLP
jgi:hypothetical protein